MPQPENQSPPGSGRPRPGRGEAAIPTASKIVIIVEEHTGRRPCSCGVDTCGHPVRAHIAHLKALVGDGPEVDGFLRQDRRKERRQRREAWLEQNGGAA